MRLAIRHLLDRLTGPRTRADELYRLRRKLVAERAPGRASDGEKVVASELRRLREEMVDRLGEVEACRRCVRPPSASWSGGHCCSGDMWKCFTDPEIASLALSGTKPSDLAPPRSDHRGCGFRGPSGCSLQPAHRPNLCVRYTCPELERELKRRGDGREILRLQARLRVEFERFLGLRSERLEAEQWAELEASFEGSSTSR